MASKKPTATPSEAEADTRALWAEYRTARDEGLPDEVYDALAQRTRIALRRYKGLPDCAVSYQQLQDLRTYIKKFRPSKPTPRVSAPALERELDNLALKELGRATTASALRALLARVNAVLRQIENEQARTADADDEDHDSFVTAQERAWDLRDALERRLAGGTAGD